MNVPKKPIFTELELGINPSVLPLVIPVYEMKIPHEYVTDEDGVMTPKTVLFEKIQKCTLFSRPEYRKLLASLSPSTNKLFVWIIYELDPNKDYIWINKDRYMKESGITSVNTYKTALEELQKNAILVRSVIPAVYWINPAMLFSGNRIEKYPGNLMYT